MGSDSTAANVHKLRTTIRRVESAIDPDEHKKLAKMLAGLRRRAGKVRDLDVQLQALEAINATELRRWRKLLAADIGKERSRRERKLLKSLAESREAGMVRRVRKALSVPHGADLIGPHDAVTRARSDFLRLTEELPTDEGAFHQLRIDSKRIRYTLERQPASPEVTQTLEDLVGVQTAIGAWHDWVTLRDRAQARFGASAIGFNSFLRSHTQQLYLEARRVIGETRQRFLVAGGAKREPTRAGARARNRAIAG